MIKSEICAGPIGALDGRVEVTRDTPTLRMEIPSVEAVLPANTVHLRFDDCEVPYRIMAGTREISSGVTTTNACFGGMTGCPPDRAVKDLREEIGEVPWAPVFYASWDHQSHGVYTHGQVRLSPTDVLFVRTSPGPVPYEVWAEEAARLHAGESTFLNNHQCYYRKCLRGQEAEHKFTLDAAAVDLWTLIVAVYDELRNGALLNFIMEYRDEFQRWDYDNYLFEIAEPADERGYISFIPTTDGRHTIKRKWYQQDALSRREEHYPSIDLEQPLEDEIRDRFGVEGKALPPFRRVRYDVNFESVETGHVYGIFFDRCSLLATPAVALAQCEVEYLRTRSVLQPDDRTVLPELERVAEWTQHFLDQHRVSYRRDFYSKLSFLQDVVRAEALVDVGLLGGS